MELNIDAILEQLNLPGLTPRQTKRLLRLFAMGYKVVSGKTVEQAIAQAKIAFMTNLAIPMDAFSDETIMALFYTDALSQLLGLFEQSVKLTEKSLSDKGSILKTVSKYKELLEKQQEAAQQTKTAQ